MRLSKKTRDLKKKLTANAESLINDRCENMNEIEVRKLDKPQDECGVFGIFEKNDDLDVARLTHYALFALQHRGQESCGIAVNDNGTIVYHKNLGLVPEVFDDVILNHLKGQIAVGHVRYSNNNTEPTPVPPPIQKSSWSGRSIRRECPFCLTSNYVYRHPPVSR